MYIKIFAKNWIDLHFHNISTIFLSTKKNQRRFFCLKHTHTQSRFLFKTHTYKHTCTHTHTHTESLCCQLFSNPWTLDSVSEAWEVPCSNESYIISPGTLRKFFSFFLFIFGALNRRDTPKIKPRNFCISKATWKFIFSKAWSGSQGRLRNQRYDVTSSCCWPLAPSVPNGSTRAWKQRN